MGANGRKAPPAIGAVWRGDGDHGEMAGIGESRARTGIDEVSTRPTQGGSPGGGGGSCMCEGSAGGRVSSPPDCCSVALQRAASACGLAVRSKIASALSSGSSAVVIRGRALWRRALALGRHGRVENSFELTRGCPPPPRRLLGGTTLANQQGSKVWGVPTLRVVISDAPRLPRHRTLPRTTSGAPRLGWAPGSARKARQDSEAGPSDIRPPDTRAPATRRSWTNPY